MPQTQQPILQHPAQFTTRKEQPIADDFEAWITQYVEMALIGVRSTAVIQKIQLHLRRFQDFFTHHYGHSKISTCVRRDIQLWQKGLKKQGLASSTINNHLASLSSFMTWVYSHSKEVLPHGNPCKGIKELSLPPLEPKTLTEAQVRSLKSICDRLSRFNEKRGRQWKGSGGLKAVARPYRDRAIVFLMLSTGLRREEVVRLNLEQLDSDNIETLRQAKKARLVGVQGKGGTERTVFLSQDARLAVADYLEYERVQDSTEYAKALFLSCRTLSARKADGRLSIRAINLILDQIGRWHDSEMSQEDRKISPLHPHKLRHTFAFQLAKATNADAYELERRLGHRSQRYIQRYTNPPEDIAAGYVDQF